MYSYNRQFQLLNMIILIIVFVIQLNIWGFGTVGRTSFHGFLAFHKQNNYQLIKENNHQVNQ